MTKKTINGRRQYDPSPEYAASLLKFLNGIGMDHDEIALRTGMHKRSVFRVAEVGFPGFALQFLWETLAGKR